MKKRIVILEEERGRLNESEQYSRRENLIITGVPRDPKENLRTTVSKILNVEIYKYDICTTHPLSNKGDAPAIVVRMNNRYKKNSLIKEGRKEIRKRELTSRVLSWRTDERIFIRDSLTEETSKLLSTAKERLRDTGFVKFVWPSEGHILMREDERAEGQHIEGEF